MKPKPKPIQSTPTLVAQQYRAANISELEIPVSNIYYNKTPSPVSAIPEYAPMGGVLIAYPGTIPPPAGHEQEPPSGPRAFGIPNELIVRMQQNSTADPVHIFVMCGDPSQKAVIDQALEETAKEIGVTYNPEHLHIIEWDTDTYWTRDYGPWWVKNNKTGYYGIVKHSYTTLGGGSVGLVEGAENVDPMEGLGIFRPNDDYGAVEFSDYLNAPIRKWNGALWGSKENPKIKKLPPINVHNWYFSGLLDVGGNYMVTGNGIIASSYLITTQNELPVESEPQVTHPDADTIAARMVYVLEQLNRFMGLNTYHVLKDPSGTYIGHIDCWGKFLADDTVLIASSQNETISKGLDEISTSFANEGFKVYRVECQDTYVPIAGNPATTAAYTNSLILNNYAYVPLSGPGYEEFDQKALAMYGEALPDHTVVGIQSKPKFPWLGTDAMHCRTRGVPRAVVNNWLKSQKPKPI